MVMGAAFGMMFGIVFGHMVLGMVFGPAFGLIFGGLLLVAEAAAYTKRGRRFLAHEVTAGRFRAARIGGRGEIPMRAEWFDAWVMDQVTPITISIARTAAR